VRLFATTTTTTNTITPSVSPFKKSRVVVITDTLSGMKWIFIFTYLLPLSLALAAENVDHLITDAERLEKEGDTDSAITVLKTADRLSPENVEVTKLLARQYVLKVDDTTDPPAKKTYAEMALDLAQKAADKLPDDSEAQVALAAAYGKLCDLVDGKTKVEYSKQVYVEATKALRLDPGSDFGHLILAQWNFQMAFLNPFLKVLAQMIYGQFPAASKEEAISQYEKAIELAPERIVHHAEFAKALDVMGDKWEARQQWTKVTELKPVYAQDKRYQAMAFKRLQAR
jgi:tetratricopeptide (TPR) repeat protein